MPSLYSMGTAGTTPESRDTFIIQDGLDQWDFDSGVGTGSKMSIESGYLDIG